MKGSIIAVVGLLAFQATGAEDWISDRFEELFPSVNVQTNGIELTFKQGMQLGFLTNNISAGNTRDYPGCFIRYGDSASFYHHHGGLSFKPLDVDDQRKKFRIMHGDSFPGGRRIRREATLLADMGVGAVEGSIAFTNEVIYESTSLYSYKVVATRNLEPGKCYEDYVDTNTMRLIQYQEYKGVDDISGKELNYSAWLKMQETLEQNKAVKCSEATEGKPKQGHMHVILMFVGGGIVLLVFGALCVKKAFYRKKDPQS